MTHTLEGISVRLKTAGNTHSGTTNHLYVGVVSMTTGPQAGGPRGGYGREFPLFSSDLDENFDEGTDVTYVLGDVSNMSTPPSNPVQSNKSKPGQRNDPARFPISVDVPLTDQRVYLRKQGGVGHNDDDAYELDLIEVTLINDVGTEKVFSNEGTDVWLGNEFGLQVWLAPIS